MIHGRFILIVTIAMLAGFQAHADQPAAVPGEYLVKLKSPVNFSASTIKSVLAQEIRVVSKSSKVMLVKTNSLIRADYAIADIKNNPNIELVEPNLIYQASRVPNDPELGELWGLLNDGKLAGRVGIDIGAEQAWDIETGSDKIVVAVIDTGVDYLHPDLQGNVWSNIAELNGTPGVDDDGNGLIDDVHGYDFVNSDGDPMDDHGHGTHCSGTIGARGDDGAGIVGVNWNVKIMGLKFLDAEGSGTLENAIKAIDFATARKVDVMSNSWGGGGFSQLLLDSIKKAQEAGILFVAAAGNSASDNDSTKSYPASYDVDNIVSVAAIDRSGKLANFSNYGGTSVHIAAPGVAVYSSIPGGHASWNGTSMATPHVSGVAALLKAHEPALTYTQIKDRLVRTSRPLGTLRGKVSSMGVVNAFYALSNQQAPADEYDPFNWSNIPQSQASPHPYASSTAETYVVKVSGVSRISAYFEKFETEAQYDVVKFKDAKGNLLGEWSGNHDGEYSPIADGDTLYIEFSSDGSVDKYGFDITKVAHQ